MDRNIAYMDSSGEGSDDGDVEEEKIELIRPFLSDLDEIGIPLHPASSQNKIVSMSSRGSIYHDEEVGMGPSSTTPDGVTRRVLSSLSECPDITIQRQALTVDQKHEQYRYEKPHKPGFRESCGDKLKKQAECSGKRVKNKLFLRFPILDWGLHYKLRRDLFNDTIAGVTVAVMNIPQGMAYAMLANLEPIVGIYMAFFPVLIYAIFASSRHCSMGTFAVICIMSGKVISEYATFPEVADQNPELYSSVVNGTTTYTPVEVASILSFAVGMWMLLFGLLNLGSLSVFLSDMLVSGFTTGASIHVLTSQVPKLFGIHIPSYQGAFKIIKSWIAIFKQVLYSNPATMVISLVCFFILIVNNEMIKPRVSKYTRIPIPIELIVVVLGTLASRYGHLNENFAVEIVGNIPTGLPPPTLPPFELYGQILLSSLTITIVSYTVSFSMAKIFAKRLDYTVDATQELYAIGLGDLMGSLFGCAPISASLSRSLIQQAVGGATQLASFISCSLLVLVLLFIGPFFETLPNSVLSSIIAVALKGMFLQVYDVVNMWKLSRVDALVWIVTFLGVVVLDIDYGLFLGIFAALVLLIARNQAPSMVILGQVVNTDMYLDKTRYASVVEIPGVKMCQVYGSLHFANQDSYRSVLMKTTGLNPRNILKMKMKREKLIKRKQQKKNGTLNSVQEPKLDQNNKQDSVIQISNASEREPETEVNSKDEKIMTISSIDTNIMASPEIQKISMNLPNVKHLIVDFSSVSQIDISASKNIAAFQKEYQSAGILMVFAGLSEAAMEMMSKSGASKDLSKDIFFHSVPDAIAFLVSPSAVEPPNPVNHF